MQGDSEAIVIAVTIGITDIITSTDTITVIGDTVIADIIAVTTTGLRDSEKDSITVISKGDITLASVSVDEKTVTEVSVLRLVLTAVR